MIINISIQKKSVDLQWNEIIRSFRDLYKTHPFIRFIVKQTWYIYTQSKRNEKTNSVSRERVSRSERSRKRFPRPKHIMRHGNLEFGSLQNYNCVYVTKKYKNNDKIQLVVIVIQQIK